MPTNVPEPLPCPFCGKVNPRIFQSGGYWKIKCEGCQAALVGFILRAGAILTWNRRPEPANQIAVNLVPLNAGEIDTIIDALYTLQDDYKTAKTPLTEESTLARKLETYKRKKEEKMTDQTPPNPPQVEPLPAVLTVGMKVKVIALTDETAPPASLGKVGSVAGVDRSGNCGSSDDDPIYIVRFDEDGRVDMFWREELGHPETIHPNRRPRFSRRLFIAGMNTIIGG